VSVPVDLGPNDLGFLLYVVDFNHLLRWNGSAWGFGPGDVGNGFYRDFAIAPQEPGWVACTGQATTYLAVGATLRAVTMTLPVSARYFRR
jgi:hypothetical protein